MRIRAVAPGHPRAWEVAAPPGTTVAALAAAVGLPRATHYALGGRAVAADAAIADTGAADGALLAPLGARPRPAAVALVAVDGPQAGTVWPLAPGEHTVGRHPSVTIALDDPHVGALHAELRVGADGSISVRDRASADGTWIGGRRLTHAAVLDYGTEVRFGVTTLRVERLGRIAPALGRLAGTPLNRPPRAIASPPPPPPPAPRPGDVPASVGAVRTLAAMLVPSLAGVAVALAVRPEMAPFAIVAPVGAVVTWLVLRANDARTAGKIRRRDHEAHHAHAARMADHRAALERCLVARHPDLGEIACRIRSRDARLWERRPRHDDFLHVAAGLGTVPCAAATEALRAVPVEIDLTRPVGIVGVRPHALAVARALVVQAIAHHGPADVTLSVWSNDPLSWRWARWVPHLQPGGRLLTERAVIDEFAASRHSAPPPAHTLVVLDTGGLPAGWRDAWRSLHDATSAAPPATAIVLAPDRSALPEQCATVVEVDGHHGIITDGAHGGPIALERVWEIGVSVAEDLAAALAPLRDPDLTSNEVGLPPTVALSSLLGLDAASDADAARDVVLARWERTRRTGHFTAPIGVDDRGVFVLDLVEDGPHGLVAGTTGSGKSELLRSLVASFAASVDAEHVSFVLVDYKGGSAFDGLASLPHVVDVVTDLDAASAMRAVRGLDAEVRRRERLLRDAGMPDITTMQRAVAAGATLAPLPRLVIVVDEFATLAQELPAFVDALVDVAQRGRSLGVHLLFATQRPTGAVKESIRTNTNLHIALRMLDATDSRDILGTADAAAIGRDAHGRAFARLGAGDVRAFQSAFVSGMSRRLDEDGSLRVVPLGMRVPQPHSEGDRPDLGRITDAVVAAHLAAGRATPSRPWADALPAVVTLAALAATARTSDVRPPADGLAFALADEPHAQRHTPAWWSPASGNLLIAGIAGSGTTTALCTLAAATVGLPAARRPDVYVVATTPTPFAWLEAFTHVGGVLATDDDERVRRLLRMACETIDRRRRGVEPGQRSTILLIDGTGALRSAYDSLAGMETLDALDRVATEGPTAGVHLVFGAEHPAAIGHRIDRTIARRVLLRLGDRSEYTAVGARDLDPCTLGPGGGIDAATGSRLQVARTEAADISACIAHERAAPRPGDRAPRVEVLPCLVHADALPATTFDNDVLCVPLGMGDRALAPRGLRLHPGDHLLVTGPARSGKSNVLELMRATLEKAGVTVVVIGTHRSRVQRAMVRREAITTGLDPLSAGGGTAARVVVLVDDADAVDDGGALDRLVGARHQQVHVVAAVRGDRLRGLFRHWTSDVRRSGHGVLLRPDDGDLDLVGVRLPRCFGPFPPGRGWLVCDGEAELCQFGAAPAPTRGAGAAA